MEMSDPTDILIGAGEVEHAFLCDFGLARHASTVASLTSDRGFAGTIAYVAPEQARGPARLAAAVGSVALATEVFSWMVRNPEHPVARALAWPGHELQHRLATTEPDAGQLEVAEAALQACVALETDEIRRNGAEHPGTG